LLDKVPILREFFALRERAYMISCILAEQPANARWSLQIAFPPKNKICSKHPDSIISAQRESTSQVAAAQSATWLFFCPDRLWRAGLFFCCNLRKPAQIGVESPPPLN
jgi:hypothetical protein